MCSFPWINAGKTVDKWGYPVEDSWFAGDKPEGIVEKQGSSRFLEISVEKSPESVDNPDRIGDEYPCVV